MNEVHILKSLKHPNIPIIYDIEEDENYSYIIEEYLQGESLKAYRLRLSNLDERIVLDFTFQICDLLQYLHTLEAGILYLDLKPENILVYKGKLKLLDFGAARYEGASYNEKCQFATRGFMAPEREHNLADQRSDIYSIGCLLYFLITGSCYQPSYISKEWAWIFVRNHRFYKLIEKCLKTNPSHRFQTVEEVKKYLCKVQKKRALYNNESVVSYKVAIAGSESRIGVTHIALTLTGYMAAVNRSSVYIEWNQNSFLKELVTYYSAVKEKQGFVYAGRIRMQEKSKWIHVGDSSCFGFQVKDYGVLSEDNMEEFLREECPVLVLGGKPWELRKSIAISNVLCDCSNLLYLYNFLDEEVERESLRRLVSGKCLFAPHLTSLFSSRMNLEEKKFLDSVVNYVVSFYEERRR